MAAKTFSPPLSLGNCAGAQEHPQVRVLPLLPGSQEALLLPGRTSSLWMLLWGQMEAHSWEQGNQSLLTFLRLFLDVGPAGAALEKSLSSLVGKGHIPV